VDLDLDLLPVPDGVPLLDWLGCFPCFAFLLTCPPERVDECVDAFRTRGLTSQALGRLTGDGRVRLVRGEQAVTVFDLAVEGVTHLRR
jgi:selenophosphate synthetase-related protein